MKLGFIILAHTNLARVGQLVEYLVNENCPVVLHIDARADGNDVVKLQDYFSDQPVVTFIDALKCEWGQFSLVQATINAASVLLKKHKKVKHVSLISGSCLPIRPISQFKEFLSRHQATDFIESVSVEKDKWVKGGLNEERFTLFFPFPWKRRRRQFDLAVKFQRALGVSRQIPRHIRPHTGSQWWCLTRATLQAILQDEDLEINERYFRSCWIPDESYFQTVARNHSERLESRSLTFAKFDVQGKPFTIFDDHMPMMQKTDAFFVRKVWKGADQLYDTLLKPDRSRIPMSRKGAAHVEAYFENVIATRRIGGVGRFNAGRYTANSSHQQSVNPYYVYVGLTDLFPTFPNWLEKKVDVISHGHLFHRKKIEFAKNSENFRASIDENVYIRNRSPKGFLMNLLWNGREKLHSFQFDLRDHQRIRTTFFKDKEAKILIIREGWILKFLASAEQGKDVISYARRLQEMERALLALASSETCHAQVECVDLKDVLKNPAQILNKAMNMLDQTNPNRILDLPKMVDLDGFNKLVRNLKNEGLSLQVGQIHLDNKPQNIRKDEVQKPKLVQ